MEKEYTIQDHASPSPETLKRIADLDKGLALNKQAMENLTDKLTEGFKQNSKEHEEIVKTFKEAMDKKADSWVEKVVIRGGSILIITMLGMLAYLIKITLFAGKI